MTESSPEQKTEASPEEYQQLRVQPLTPHLGAEIFGADLAATNPQQQAEIHRAFLEHGVLVFRDQNIDREQHKRFGRQFGALHVHPSVRYLGAKGDPEIFTIRTTPSSEYTNGEGWHSDVSCEAIPPMASILYVREMPGTCGGDTLFANMYEAYDALSPPVCRLLETLTAVHDGRKDLAAYNFTLKPGQRYPAAEHPVVARHPETDRKLLFVNSSFTSHIPQLERRESEALLEMLYRHIETGDRFQCRVRWAPGTVTLWDNRCTQHHAIWDYYPNTRSAERVTVAGTTRPAR